MRDEYQIEIQEPDAAGPWDFTEEEPQHLFIIREENMDKQKIVVRFFSPDGVKQRVDKFTFASDAGLWLRLNGYRAKGQTTKGKYVSENGYALVDYGR